MKKYYFLLAFLIACSSSQETTTESQETMETKLEIPETIKIESEHVNCTIPGFVPEGYKKNYFELSTELGNNKPKKNAEMCILFSESIPDVFRVYQLDIMEKLIDYVGGYDRWVHIVYEPEDQALEALDALDKFDFFYDNNHEKVEPTLQFVHENRSCFLDLEGNKIVTLITLICAFNLTPKMILIGRMIEIRMVKHF